ncbi:transketolase [Loigolactobacillus zhaoyuanensis]|uniref:transketolase n=1 Tax=Loigolactobacillus zhaoyuanensis TaxID=2486017 RepID=UPI000F73904D|nr:transketolase [Loigolactobacillus zhaoyuanensis]
MFDETDQLSVNALRALSIDMIERAGSGHPGLPLDAAPMAYVLYSRHLRVDPQDPNWTNRDRFVLSAGHGSALLYSLLHLSGFPTSMADLQQFRQLHSMTPGHPEHGLVAGVDATTGPLGQGLGMAVGMAMAETHLAAQFNMPQQQVIDHFTYVICGDGDLMEGISHEAASLAGNLKLNKLIVLYDSNDVSLDGATDRTFSDDAQQRFTSYGWDYQKVSDGNDLAAIDTAITAAKAATDAPSIIEIKTTIGFGAPKQGTHLVHGAPLGQSDLAVTKRNLGWQAEPFTVPAAVKQRFQKQVQQRGQSAHQQWQTLLTTYAQAQPALAEQLQQALTQKLPVNWQADLPQYQMGTSEAGRTTSQKMIQALAAKVPSLWGGAADLASSNKTDIAASNSFSATARQERNLNFGVREFAEAAAMNGIALHGGTHVFGGTFFVFSDYMRGAIRLAALQHLPVTYIFTHDSLAVGEDGPTHEPVEQLMSLRAMPGISVIRPADPNEAVAAWRLAMTTNDRPTVLVLTRQELAVLQGSLQQPNGVSRGGYVISPQQHSQAEGILMASGSEVALAIKAQQQLRKFGHDVAVVSMPCFDRFMQQSAAYREQVLPQQIRRRVSIELGVTLGWERFVGLDGLSLGVDTFGASGPAAEVLAEYGFTTAALVAAYQKLWRADHRLQTPIQRSVI